MRRINLRDNQNQFMFSVQKLDKNPFYEMFKKNSHFMNGVLTGGGVVTRGNNSKINTVIVS